VSQASRHDVCSIQQPTGANANLDLKSGIELSTQGVTLLFYRQLSRLSCFARRLGMVSSWIYVRVLAAYIGGQCSKAYMSCWSVLQHLSKLMMIKHDLALPSSGTISAPRLGSSF